MRRGWRRPAVLLALVLSVGSIAAAVVAIVAFEASPIVLALGAILAIAPWAAIIDDGEKPRRRD
ncbi:MAG TPA: hypothetical protein VFV33_11320 [Gemmatimonadaceae bacterium]|nr:hypothetical protein [Gemmatimonadaceae bacterium]